MTKHVAFYCDSDSQLFGVTAYVEYFLDAGWKVSINLGVQKGLPKAVLGAYKYQNLITATSYDEFLSLVCKITPDAVGFFSRASIIAKFRFDLEQCSDLKSGKRSAIFTGFNGLSYEKSEEGFAWRIGYDFLCLNGPRDTHMFSEFVVGTRFENQPIVVTGIRPEIVVNNSSNPPKSTKKYLVFAEQLLVPDTYKARLYLAKQLIRIARLNPSWQIIVKCRTKRLESTFHFQSYYFPDVLNKAGEKPDNLEISFEPMGGLLVDCNLLLTISSTAVVDAYRNKVPIAVISDFGVQNNHGSHMFVGSDLGVKLIDINGLDEFNPKAAKKEWLYQVGLTDFDPRKLVEKLGKSSFVWERFEPSYYDGEDLERLQEISKKTFSDMLNASVLWISSVLIRMFIAK